MTSNVAEPVHGRPHDAALRVVDEAGVVVDPLLGDQNVRNLAQAFYEL